MKPLVARDGEIEVGGVRACLLDVTSGFMSLRRSVENALGEVTAILLYNAGFAGYRDFAASAVVQGEFGRDTEGFRKAVAAYRASGFGGFEVVDIEFHQAWARVRCVDPMAFEAYGVLKREEGELKAVCDYSRGALAGILSQLTGRNDRLCIETKCRAKGDAECLFEIGDERILTARLLREG